MTHKNPIIPAKKFHNEKQKSTKMRALGEHSGKAVKMHQNFSEQKRIRIG